jgi:DNA helicase-2/ATP-dependent DNA helicase PcrA
MFAYFCKLILKPVELKYLNDLNESQRMAVQAVEGPVMIIAGAGSGKTRVLTYRIAYLIQHGVDPFNVLSLTFTNKAAKEMKERIGRVIGESEAKNLWMGTFHSIFSRILRVESEKIGYPTNFTIYDTDDAKSLLKSIINELGLDDKIYKPNIIYNRISSAKNSLITAKQYVKHPDITTDDQLSGKPKTGLIYEKYAMRCFKAGAMDFDDLLLKTYELFHRYPEVLYKYQQRFKFIMVDEFQDTNFAQYSIIKQLAALYQNICVVGDDAQSIYAFRGATIQNILNFENDYPDLKTFKLEQNYRSTQTIVNAANSIIEKNQVQHKKKVWTANQEGNKIKIFRATTDNEEGNFVAQLIFENKMNLHLNNSDFAILYRTNAQSRSIEEALRRFNIPYRIYGGISFYQRKEIKDLLSYFRLVINPHDEEAMKRIINYPIRSIGKTTLEKITIAASENEISIWNVLLHIKVIKLGLNTGTLNKIEEFVIMMQSFMSMLGTKNAYDLASHIASSTGILKELYADKTPEGVSRYENIQELLNGIKEFSEQENENEQGNVLAKFMEEIALLTDADNDKDNDPNKVSLMTIHAAKGLEFPQVFIVGMEENLFPSQLSVNSREDLEEERRLFYVAVTRAMAQVTLSYALNRFRWGTPVHCEPSRFLAEINPDFLEVKTASGMSSRKVDETKRTSPQHYAIPAGSPLKKINQQPVYDVQGDPISAFSPGCEVMHIKFGRGTILAIDGDEINKMATIRFQEGEKKLLLKFAKLSLIK